MRRFRVFAFFFAALSLITYGNLAEIPPVASPDGAYTASLQLVPAKDVPNTKEAVLVLQDVKTGKELQQLPIPDADDTDERNSIELSWSPDGRALDVQMTFGQLSFFTLYHVVSGKLLDLKELPRPKKLEIEPEQPKSHGRIYIIKWTAPDTFVVNDTFSEAQFTYRITKDWKLQTIASKRIDPDAPSGTASTNTKNSSKNDRDDPFTDDQELAAADRQLNSTYAALLKRLPPDQRESLRAEQREWIAARNDTAHDAAKNDPEGSHTLRNKSLLESTQKRNTELNKRIEDNKEPESPNTDEPRVIDCGKEHAVTFENTTSPDGAYAIGWTLRPKRKDVPEVKWSEDGPENVEEMPTGWNEDDEKLPYKLIDCLIDIRRKKLVELPSDCPYVPHKNHWNLEVKWSQETNGRRYGLLANQARFSTSDLWLIAMNRDGRVEQTNLERKLDEEAEKIITIEKRPPDRYEVWSDVRSAEFRENEVEIPFDAEVPKSQVDEGISGSLTVRLRDAVVTKITNTSKRNDPFNDDPQLATADRQLNDAYNALLKRLSPDQREALRKEQREWIAERDDTARDAVDNAARNKSLLESTQSRNAELKKRLNQLEHGRH